MIWFLRILFLVVIASMVTVTSWAGMHCTLFGIPPDVLRHPWFIATLFDAYWGFTTFYVWLAWKEQSLAARLLWFIAVMGLGNLAMATYMLVELFKLPASGPLFKLFAERRHGKRALPLTLALLTVVVYAIV